MKHIISILIVAAILLATSCEMRVNNPESRDYPCGPLGVVCSGDYPHAMCCWQGDVCGTEHQGVDGEPFAGCPAGYCCFVGTAKGIAGYAHEPYLQFQGR